MAAMSQHRAVFFEVLQPFPRPHDEYGLFRRQIQVGFDGSLVKDNMRVYVLTNPCRGVQRVDYFHGLVDGVPMSQLCGDEADVSATEMINISKGYTTVRIIHLQRRVRLWLSNRRGQ